MQLDYTVSTAKSHADAVQAVVDRTAAHGFRVQFVHDVAGDARREGLRARSADHRRDVQREVREPGAWRPTPRSGSCCRARSWSTSRTSGRLISTMRPTLIGGFFPEAGIDEVAAEVEQASVAIIDEAAA